MHHESHRPSNWCSHVKELNLSKDMGKVLCQQGLYLNLQNSLLLVPLQDNLVSGLSFVSDFTAKSLPAVIPSWLLSSQAVCCYHLSNSAFYLIS